MSLRTQLRLRRRGSRSLRCPWQEGWFPAKLRAHTHLPSRSSVPLFRTNRKIKHSVMGVAKAWGRTLGWDKVGRQLVNFSLYLYFSWAVCHLTPHPPAVCSFPLLEFSPYVTGCKRTHWFCHIRTHRSAASQDDKLCLSLRPVASWSWTAAFFKLICQT